MTVYGDSETAGVYTKAPSDSLEPDTFCLLNELNVQYINCLIADHPLSSHAEVDSPELSHASPGVSATSSSASPTAAETPAASVSVTAGSASADSPTTRTSTPVAKPYFDISLSRAEFTLWQQPMVSAWTDIQTVACRAFAALEWLSDKEVEIRLEKQRKGPTSAWHQALVGELVGLVHGVLVGHVMDPHLNMKKVFR